MRSEKIGPAPDYVSYLPLDTPLNARKFYQIVEPNLAIFVKYEYWLNLLRVMQEHKVPVLMISAIF
jgi:3-deoxy-D-manno-octulosonic-acid transferase